MELPGERFEHKEFNRESKFEKQTLIVIDNYTREEHLSQPLQTNKKHFKMATIFLTGYSVIFKVTNKYNKLYFAKPITDNDGFYPNNSSTGCQ